MAIAAQGAFKKVVAGVKARCGRRVGKSDAD